jgi:cell wall-associated NlpC family hydrolase
MTAGTSALATEVARFVDSQASVPLPLVDVAVDETTASPVLRGRVLTTAQASSLAKIAADHGASAEVEVIADPAQRLEQAWLVMTGPALEIWRDPQSIGEDSARQTEYLAGDGHLRLLGRLPGALLVQGPDLTIGWIDETAVAAAEPESSRVDWERRVRAAPDVAVGADPAIIRLHVDLPARLMATAREALETPYRWGGTTQLGYDCSGLVQRLFSLTTGVLLPKHTGDQRHVGVRVGDGGGRACDVLFGTPLGQKVGHVMLLTSPASVLHACRTEERVIEESIEENARRYQHQGYRRPVELF